MTPKNSTTPRSRRKAPEGPERVFRIADPDPLNRPVIKTSPFELNGKVKSDNDAERIALVHEIAKTTLNGIDTTGYNLRVALRTIELILRPAR